MSAKTSPLLVKIENEVTTADGIQRYTESAMKELLGWYGYDSHEPIDIVTSNSSNLSAMALTHDLPSTIANDIGTTVTMLMSKRHRNAQSTDKMNNGNAVMENVDLTNAVPFKNAASADKQDDCGWCKRPVSLGSTEFLASPEGLIYCTESCFTQSRRASFKRAKTCDWCKHIRHAISYVDFQDGATQLQFCSDKCLNQYKMQIFCKETQAHLDMNPHLKEKGSSSTNSLITPELWLKDCQSRSVSPSNSDRSRSSTSPSGASRLVCSTPTNTTTKQQHQRPFITVAPASKLISRTDCTSIRVPLRDGSTQARSRNSMKSTRVVRTRRSQRLHLNVGQSVYRNACKNNSDEQNITRNVDPCRSTAEKFETKSHSSQQKPIQSSDIEMCRQSAARNLLQSLKSAPANAVNPMQRHQLLPPPPDLYPLNSYHRQQRPSLGLPHIGATIQQTPSSVENRSPAIDAIPSPFPRTPMFGVLQTLPSPPMTLLVPCPIIVPFPVPIPVPLPFESFLKAAKIKLDAETAHPNHSKTPDSVLSDSDTNETFSMDLLNDSDHLHSNSFIEQPLDFTKEAAKKFVSEPHDETTDTHIDLDSIDSQYDINVENKFLSKLNSRSVAKRLFNRESERSRPLRKRKRIIDLITC